MKPTINRVEVITVFSSGTKVKFDIEYSEFWSTMTADNNRRLDMWMEADNDKPYTTFYKITKLKFNNLSNKLEMVELTPIETSKA